MNAQNLKRLGILLTLCGVALFVYNVFNYEPAFSAIGSRGSYYAGGAKIGMAVGALLAVGGIFSYIEGWRRGISS